MPKWFQIVKMSRLIWRFLLDPKADWKPKAAVAAGILYLVWPMDLVTDLVPFIGWLDDLGFESVVVWYMAKSLKEYADKNKL